MKMGLLCTIIVTGISAAAFAQDNRSEGYEMQPPSPPAEVVNFEPSRSAMQLSIKVFEKAANGSRERVLTDPTLAVTVGRPFSFHSGGQLKAKFGDGDLDYGTRINGVIRKTSSNSAQLAIKIDIGEPVPQTDADAALVKTESLEIRTAMQPGETKLFKCSSSRWCEIHAGKIEAIK